MSEVNERHEASDASIPTILGTAVAVGVLIGVSLVVGWTLWQADPALRRPHENELFSHGPRARTDIALDWDRLQRETHERLETYGWVDRKAGSVHIPIEQAMKRVAQEGEK